MAVRGPTGLFPKRERLSRCISASPSRKGDQRSLAVTLVGVWVPSLAGPRDGGSATGASHRLGTEPQKEAPAGEGSPEKQRESRPRAGGGVWPPLRAQSPLRVPRQPPAGSDRNRAAHGGGRAHRHKGKSGAARGLGTGQLGPVRAGSRQLPGQTEAGVQPAPGRGRWGACRPDRVLCSLVACGLD